MLTIFFLLNTQPLHFCYQLSDFSLGTRLPALCQEILGNPRASDHGVNPRSVTAVCSGRVRTRTLLEMLGKSCSVFTEGLCCQSAGLVPGTAEGHAVWRVCPAPVRRKQSRALEREAERFQRELLRLWIQSCLK